MSKNRVPGVPSSGVREFIDQKAKRQKPLVKGVFFSLSSTSIAKEASVFLATQLSPEPRKKKKKKKKKNHCYHCFYAANTYSIINYIILITSPQRTFHQESTIIKECRVRRDRAIGTRSAQLELKMSPY